MIIVTSLFTISSSFYSIEVIIFITILSTVITIKFSGGAGSDGTLTDISDLENTPDEGGFLRIGVRIEGSTNYLFDFQKTTSSTAIQTSTNLFFNHITSPTNVRIELIDNFAGGWGWMSLGEVSITNAIQLV